MNKRWSDGLLFFFYRVVYRVFFFYIHENGTQREEEQEGKEEREGNEWRRRRRRWMMSENGGALLAIASASRRQSSSFFFVFISATLAPVPSALTVVENLGFTGFYRVLLVFFSGFYREKERCVWFCRKKNEKLRKTARDWLPARGPGRDWIVRRWRHDGWAIDDVTEPLLPFFWVFFVVFLGFCTSCDGTRKVSILACLIGRWWRHCTPPPMEKERSRSWRVWLVVDGVIVSHRQWKKKGPAHWVFDWSLMTSLDPTANRNDASHPKYFFKSEIENKRWRHCGLRPVRGVADLWKTKTYEERTKEKKTRKKENTHSTDVSDVFRFHYCDVFVDVAAVGKLEKRGNEFEKRRTTTFFKKFFWLFFRFFSVEGVRNGRPPAAPIGIFPKSKWNLHQSRIEIFSSKKKIRRDPRKNEKKKYISRFRSRWWDLGEVHRRVR